MCPALDEPKKINSAPKRVRAVFGAKWGGLSIFIIGLLVTAMPRGASYRADQPLLPLKGLMGLSLGGGGHHSVALRDDNGHVLATCNTLHCGYPGRDADMGKQATFWVQGHQVFKVEVDGIVKVDEETIVTRRDGMKMLPVFIAIGGIIIFALSFLM